MHINKQELQEQLNNANNIHELIDVAANIIDIVTVYYDIRKINRDAYCDLTLSHSYLMSAKQELKQQNEPTT